MKHGGNEAMGGYCFSLGRFMLSCVCLVKPKMG